MRRRSGKLRKAAQGADGTPGVDGISITVHPWVPRVRSIRILRLR